MKNIFLILMLLNLIACGNNSSDSKMVENAHNNETSEELKWADNTSWPLVIKVPVEASLNANFMQALEGATNTWNVALRPVIGQNVFRVESFDNTVSNQADLENSLLSIKCTSKYDSYCSSCETQGCTDFCDLNSKSDCDLSDTNKEFKPLKIVDYLRDDHMVVSNPSDWFEEVSDLTIAITGYTYDVNTNIIIKADIIFNQEFYNFAYSDPVLATQIDYESSLLHELGHFLGLKHVEKSEDPSSIMNPSLSKGQIKRNLSDKDKETIQNLYK